MCHAWTHLCRLSQIEVRRTSDQSRMHGRVVSIHCEYAKPSKTIRKEPILNPGATRHQQAGSGIWHCDMPRKAQKQHFKKVARNKHNMIWQGSRHNDVEALNQVFGMNEVEIKRKSLEALRLLRHADQALEEIHKFITDRTEYV
jgi:hypothetical protein